MLFLAVFLSWGWPKMEVEYVPHGAVCPSDMVEKRVPNPCTGSMRPLLNGGERVFLEPYHGQPTLGKIIEDERCLHLVVAENDTSVKTSGIHNDRSDAWEPKSKVHFIVRYIVRP